MLNFILVIFLTSAETTVTTDGASLDASTGPSADIQAVADRFSNYNKCADKVWPKPLLGQSTISLVDKDNSVWKWSAEGLKKVASSAEAKNILSLVGTSNYVVNRNTKPEELILNLNVKKGQKSPPPDKASPPSTGSKSPACEKAAKAMKESNIGLYNAPEPSPVDKAFRLGVHENFHVHDQSNTQCWKHNLDSNSPSMDRINDYPTKVEPRQMRYKLKTALRKALQEKNPTARQALLQEAAYWHKEYKKKYGSKESHHSPDRFEGTARYVDLVAGKIDCSKNIDSNSLAEISRAAVLEGVSEASDPSVDSESYSLGALAGAMLDQQRALGWKSKTADDGKSPLDLLLESVTPKTGALQNTSQLDAIAGTLPQFTDECLVKPDLEYLKNYKNGKYVWVSVPTTKYGGKGSYDGNSVVPSKLVNIGASAHTSNMTTKNLPHVVSSQNPCGGVESMMVLVELSSVQNGTVDFSKAGEPPSSVQGKVEAQPKSSSLGNVYCSPP